MATDDAARNIEVEENQTKTPEDTTQEGKHQSCTDTEKFLSAADWVTLLERRGHYRPLQPGRLRNSLLAGVGFLELGNAGDFAANVWNEVPVKKWVAVLMALGATMALVTSLFAFRDVALSWRNIQVLRRERSYLKRERARCRRDKASLRSVDAIIGVNFRESGTELLDRLIVDVLLGFGAFLVSIGTYMAIGGANPSVFKASNLLSGYIGNAAGAIYGLVNAGWSAYVSIRAHRHRSAGLAKLDSDLAKRLLRHRTHKVQTHALVLAVTGLAAGAGGLITATMWWGYIILVPCIISNIYCNWMWRHQIGYERPIAGKIVQIDQQLLIKELEYVDLMSNYLGRRARSDPPKDDEADDLTSIVSVIQFMLSIDIFESFCVRVMQERRLSAALLEASEGGLTICEQTFLELDQKHLPLVLALARTHISERGPVQLRYRERYLLETLGCYLRVQDDTVVSKVLDPPLPKEPV
ncbi:uncharacterized protein Z520_03165 [Fonsecaea multimorphosa CBS 102226]|uniref:Integral membrane protein n=1 Tax=Fonsecaea multimorphosa CBS 102226 TaxID=1442371 RepID=A0A0D2K6T8_9EURO|nr:uncharacterized protein Z520_03165 [Fonsecaea multimorphosa CBS 102226]KIY01613.1 hypothetical protein Z520_03165 [Fonsecaea multimorphosa CBS 102226]OAL28124.1 hypothetical protein AYO22_03151 [Fonsecaea multimorphosa]